MNTKCRASNTNLVEVIDFGRQPLGNGFLTNEQFKSEYFFDMKVGFSEQSKLLQLVEQPDAGQMFHDEYPFFSSTSRYMEQHFKMWGDKVKHEVGDKKATIIEIGCNDGIFIQNFVMDND